MYKSAFSLKNVSILILFHTQDLRKAFGCAMEYVGIK